MTAPKRVIRYVMTFDGGGAPNFEPPVTTLVVCKPRIRRKAQVGDLVLAFNGKPLSPNPHSVRWAGVVSEVIAIELYWGDKRFRSKRPDHARAPDNIYRLESSAWIQEPNTTHDPGQLANDIWGQNALIFGQSWYYGDHAPELPEEFDLRVSARRCEPMRDLHAGEWSEIKAWLDNHHQINPNKRRASARKCGGC